MSTETLREGLTYKVICTGSGVYRIGAVIDPSKVVHTGNLHLLPTLYGSREEAQEKLDALLAQKVVTPAALYQVFLEWFASTDDKGRGWDAEESAADRAKLCTEYLWSKL